MKSGYKLLSYVLSPIVFPILGTILYFIFLPSFVAKQQVYLIFIMVFGGTYLLPVLLMGLFKKTATMQYIFDATVQARKFPTLLFLGIMVGIANMLSKVESVQGLTLFFFGYAVALACVYFFLMIQLKISFHAVAVGGLTAFMICLSHYFAINLLVPVGVLILTGGFLLSGRLYLKSPGLKEVFFGYLMGCFGQFLMYGIYNI
ncbi:MAG: hypothetical protein JKY08_05560 [Flavobacteriaceae bacterium]|nr:hypothetical protein [Flavobacteriaceae bacterium]